MIFSTPHSSKTNSTVLVDRPLQAAPDATWTGVRANPKGPAADDDSLPVSDTSLAARCAPSNPLRVLIVEDEAIIAMDLEMLLEDLGAKVVGVAMSAEEAEALVAEHRPDFVTMDINIKGDRDGVSAAQSIVEKFGIRSIFVSAYTDLDIRRRAEPCHAIAWIDKPIDDKDLADAVALVNRSDD